MKLTLELIVRHRLLMTFIIRNSNFGYGIAGMNLSNAIQVLRNKSGNSQRTKTSTTTTSVRVYLSRHSVLFRVYLSRQSVPVTV